MKKSYLAQEVEKFSKYAAKWADNSGEMRMLHEFNPIRIEYITRTIEKHFHANYGEISILDFGCGGGILSNSLAKLGFNVTGVDPSAEIIKVAQASCFANLKYQVQDDFISENIDKFDVIVVSEVLEHVPDLELFFLQIMHRLAPGGLVIISTINRTIESLVLAKFCAEYILKIVPKHTHNWKAFLRPSEINEKIEKYNMKSVDITGVNYNPFIRKFSISRDIKMNYFITFKNVG